MRFAFLSTFALLVLGVVSTPLQEESSTIVGVAEDVSCQGSHFIVSVQRYTTTQAMLTYSEQMISKRIQEN